MMVLRGRPWDVIRSRMGPVPHRRPHRAPSPILSHEDTVWMCPLQPGSRPSPEPNQPPEPWETNAYCLCTARSVVFGCSSPNRLRQWSGRDMAWRTRVDRKGKAKAPNRARSLTTRRRRAPVPGGLGARSQVETETEDPCLVATASHSECTQQPPHRVPERPLCASCTEGPLCAWHRARTSYYRPHLGPTTLLWGQCYH